MSGLVVRHSGTDWFAQGIDDWKLQRGERSPEGQQHMDEAAREGVIHVDGKRLVGPTLDRLRTRLAGTYDDFPQMGRGLSAGVGGEPRRWLIPGLWPWGYKPALYGNHKAGRSTLVAELAAAIMLCGEGYRFLDHFAPADVTENEFYAGIRIINAESPPDAFERELVRRGLMGDDTPVMVDHLRDYGGPQMFDLTDREVYERWAVDLDRCNECLGEDPEVPFVLIVDGMSAIVGEQTSRYGEWLVKFHQLMDEVGIENALTIGHATQDGTRCIDSSGGRRPDGLWFYWRSDVNRDDSARYFRAEPRLDGPAISRTAITKDPDGRLVWGRTQKRAGVAEPVRPTPDPSVTVKEQVYAYIAGCNDHKQGPSVREVRENVPGRNPEKDQALDELKAEGRIEERGRAGRGGGYAYWIVT